MTQTQERHLGGSSDLRVPLMVPPDLASSDATQSHLRHALLLTLLSALGGWSQLVLASEHRL